MIIEGKKIAAEVIAGLANERGSFSPHLALGVVMGKGDAATESFVRIKTRVAEKLNVALVREELPQGATTADAIAAVERLAARTSGVIVQLPLPSDIAVNEVLAAIPATHDVDAVRSVEPRAVVRAPVAEAISEILVRTDISAANKKAVVVGSGRLVGAPAAELLRELGAHVAVVNQVRGSLLELAQADIVVLGAGEPGFIKPDMLKEGVVLIDAGTSESSGKLVGDADPECARKASVFTPVPGGVGPIAVAMIFKNLFTLASRAGTRNS